MMNPFLRQHCRIMVMIPVTVIGIVAATLLLEQNAGILVPSISIPLALSGCIFFDAVLRLSFWRKYQKEISHDQKNTRQAHLFIISIPAELLFGIIIIIIAFNS